MMRAFHDGDVVDSTAAARGHASGWKVVAMVDREIAHTTDFAMDPGENPGDGALVGQLASPTH
jgi:hypothetical protein